MKRRKSKKKKQDKYLYAKKLVLLALIVAQLLSYREKVIAFLSKQSFVKRYVASLVVDDMKDRGIFVCSFVVDGVKYWVSKFFG